MALTAGVAVFDRQTGRFSYYWDELGGGPIVDRMVSRLGLTHTARPPATHPGFWGYVAITAADTVRIYRYLLEQAPAPVREYVMGNLYQATRCGTDGFDQYFGIASVFDLAFSVKQGWSGFMNSRGVWAARGRWDRSEQRGLAHHGDGRAR